MHRTLTFAFVLIGIGLAGLLVSRLIAKPAARPAAEQKAPHFVDSTPVQGQVFAYGTNVVVVNFDRELLPFAVVPDGIGISSGIFVTDPTGQSIVKDREPVIDGSRITLRANLASTGFVGTYHVAYDACFTEPEGNRCYRGAFTYTVDPALATRYVDRTGQTEVTVHMSALAFDAPSIRVSRGTTVVWVNDEDVEHFVNTDPHPSHTLFPIQNSLGLKKGETFKTTFTAVGEYPYHCSAHVPQGMVGAVLVEASPG